MGGLAWLGLVIAGFGGGLCGSVAGLASLVSYPALLAAGLPPVTANVSNTVALVSSSVGSIWGSRPELRGQAATVRGLGGLAVAGGAAGSLLLLALPSRSFVLLAPGLIAFASLVILVRPAAAEGRRRASRATGPVVFLVAVYAGYFGAAAGVILIALFLSATSETLARSNALKNVLLGLANAVAAVGFALFGPVRWSAVVPLAIGFVGGGRLGPVVVRKAPIGPLRVIIGVAGLGLALRLAVDAYR